MIVGSDAPLKQEHFDRISLVRYYLEEKEKSHKFLKFSVIYFQNNVGEISNGQECHALAKSYRHETFVLMEDDVIVGRHFLKFMYQALEKYADNQDIVAVNGYLGHELKNTPKSAFLHNRFSSYGYGSWYKKWDEVLRKRDAVNYPRKMLDDLSKFREIVKFTPYVRSYPFLAERVYRAGDIEIGLMMEFEEFWTLVPPVSLTANRGMDGSGLRSGINKEIQMIVPSDSPIELPPAEKLQKYRFQELRDKISSRSLLLNWTVFGIYRFLPFGFPLLRKLRSFKKAF